MNGNLLTCCCVQHTPSSGGSGSGVTPGADRSNGGYAIPGTSGVGSTTFDIMYMYPVAYCGWDASNPDINNEDSWPELALS